MTVRDGKRSVVTRNQSSSSTLTAFVALREEDSGPEAAVFDVASSTRLSSSMIDNVGNTGVAGIAECRGGHGLLSFPRSCIRSSVPGSVFSANDMKKAHRFSGSGSKRPTTVLRTS